MTTTFDPVFGEVPDAPPPLLSSAAPVAATKAATGQISTSTADPALALLTPAFWELIEDRAWSFAALSGEDDFSYEERLRKKVDCSVLLTEIADAIGIPADYTRAYLRAIHGRLEALGVKLRERRLEKDADLSSQYWTVAGKFVSPAEKAAAGHAKGGARREIAAAKAAIDKGDTSSETMAKLNNARRTLAEAEAEIAELNATGTHLPVARHAFAVVIDRSIYQ